MGAPGGDQGPCLSEYAPTTNPRVERSLRRRLRRHVSSWKRKASLGRCGSGGGQPRAENQSQGEGEAFWGLAVSGCTAWRGDPLGAVQEEDVKERKRGTVVELRPLPHVFDGTDAKGQVLPIKEVTVPILQI